MKKQANTPPTDDEYKAALKVVCRLWAANAIEAIEEDKEPDAEIDESVVRSAVTPIVNDGDETDPDDWDQATYGQYQLVCLHYGVKPKFESRLPF